MNKLIDATLLLVVLFVLAIGVTHCEKAVNKNNRLEVSKVILKGIY